MMGELQIDYETLEQDARRGIVRTVLAQVAELGRLPGEHHFYIAFDTRAPGVVVSKRLKQKYPEEMTIVLQHQFSSLTVTDDRFEVTLSFGNVPERLIVPLRAVRVFFDPSVPYGLQFDNSDLVKEAAGRMEPRDADAAADGDRPLGARGQPSPEAQAEPLDRGALAKMNGTRKPRAARDAHDEMPATPPTGSGGEPSGAAVQRRQASRPAPVAPRPDQPANDAKVVQLDKFRKR
jgi:uncharacterized protein